MNRHTMKIGPESFIIIGDDEFGSLQRTAVQLIRDGGGMIDVIQTECGGVSALLSPGVPVFFFSDVIDVDDDDPDDVRAGLQAEVEGDFSTFANVVEKGLWSDGRAAVADSETAKD